MATDMPLLIGGTGLVRGTVKGLGPVLSELSHEIGRELNDKGYLATAPFRCISMILRYGSETGEAPEIGRINQHEELEVATQVAISELQSANGEVCALKIAIEPHIRRALIVVFDKYRLVENDA